MAGRYLDLLGTAFGKFRLGLQGIYIKNNAGVLEARNAADSAYAAMAAALFSTFGDDFELNKGAAGSGADWKMTVRRPSSGMTLDVVLVMPAGGAPSVGQALTVASVAGGVITFQYTTVDAGTDKVVSDTTSIAFGSASPIAMFNKPIGAIVKLISVVIDTAFDGTPSMSIGISGTTSKYMASTLVDLKAVAGTVFEINPGLPADAGIEALIATYAAGGASVGAGRILVDYVIPS